MNFQTMIHGFRYENIVNFTLIMYRYCKLYKWFIDMKYIDEYDFTRTCLWIKVSIVLYGFGSTELSV